MYDDDAVKRENSTHVRLCDEADSVLELLANARGRAKGDVASELLTEALLGRGHGLRMAALRFARAGIAGKVRE